LSPVALIVSLVGLLKQPRGLATAGTVISGLSTLIVVGTFVGVGMASRAGYAQVKAEAQRRQTHAAMVDASRTVEAYRDTHGQLPLGIEGNKLVLRFVDAWGRPVRYEYDEELATYSLRSVGADGQHGTGDDHVLVPSVSVLAAR
jgi:hypothetical protein